VHIEDQLFPKRAHYHTYVAHNIPRRDYRDKIALACRQRDESDRDFVIIARSDACREQGFAEAIARMRIAADAGADMGLIFPRNHKEAVQTPKLCRLPMIYVQSRGNRDGRPDYSYGELRDMGYAGCIDAILAVGVHFHFLREAFRELKETGDFSGLTKAEFIAARAPRGRDRWRGAHGPSQSRHRAPAARRYPARGATIRRAKARGQIQVRQQIQIRRQTQTSGENPIRGQSP
jgi:methylisocitrate lyase